MVQSVTELVKQGDDLLVAQQRRLVADGRCEVAGKESNRKPGCAVYSQARVAAIHPGAAAFVGPRVQVQVELAAQITGFIDRAASGQAPDRSDATPSRRAAAGEPFDPRGVPAAAGLALIVVMGLIAAASEIPLEELRAGQVRGVDGQAFHQPLPSG